MDHLTLESLNNLLDEAEAQSIGLDVKTYRTVVGKIITNQDGIDRITVVAFEKSCDRPVGMSTFCKNVLVDPEHVQPLPTSNGMGNIVKGASRKVYFEL